MKKYGIFGLVASVAAGAAAALAVDKVVKEIKSDIDELGFVSPEGDNSVVLLHGASKTAKGLMFIKIKAATEAKDDSCEFIAFTKKRENVFAGEWIDNDHFKLLIGTGKKKQCFDVLSLENGAILWDTW